MLTIQRLTHRVGGTLLFDDAAAQIGTRRRIGVVGRNGAGKSTLLHLIAGDQQPDDGQIVMNARMRIGHVGQFAPSGEAALIDVVLAADRERAELMAKSETASDPERIAEIHNRLADIGAHSAPARAATILAGLGFDQAAQARSVGSFSGGWRMRVALAAALFSAPDFLLLDEPTNHLDLEASLWLETFLSSYPYSFLMVSHDRALLNRAVDGILHVEGGKLALYPGGYDRFERTRRERLAREADMQKHQQKERERIQAFVDRFRAQANKARQAQSRIKLLERMEPIAAAQKEGTIQFSFPTPAKLAPPLLSVDRAAVGYAPGHPVLANLELRIDMDDRIGLLGQNGNGKSTLLRFLANQIECDAGFVTRSRKLRVGYFAQDQLEQLTPTHAVYDHIAERLDGRPDTAIRSHLGRFGFGQEKADLPIASLSGGERARLVLAGICCDAPQLLLLDEPTNHLDIDAREALLQALNEYPGAIIMVTHDHHLLARAVDRLWLVADGTCAPFDGDLEGYRRGLFDQKSSPVAPSNRPLEDATKRVSKQETRRHRASARAALAGLRKTVRESESELNQLTTERQQIETVLADPATYEGDAARVPALSRRKAEVERRISAVEEAWIAAQDALDAEQSRYG